jgi:hypothetical protein
MENLNSKDLVDLWESWDNHGKLHIGYGVSINPFIFSIHGSQGLKECIIVSPKIVFVSYQECLFFSLFLMLQNFELTIGKSCF